MRRLSQCFPYKKDYHEGVSLKGKEQTSVSYIPGIGADIG